MRVVHYIFTGTIFPQEIQDRIQTMCWLCCGLKQTWRNVTHSNSKAADKLLLRLNRESDYMSQSLIYPPR